MQRHSHHNLLSSGGKRFKTPKLMKRTKLKQPYELLRSSTQACMWQSYRHTDTYKSTPVRQARASCARNQVAP